MREVLGHQLAEDHRERWCRAPGRRRPRSGATAPSGTPAASSGPSISVGDRRLGEEADGQVGDGDADLGAGELGRQRAQGLLHAAARRCRPSAAACSTLARSTVTKENSAATNTPHAAISSSAASEQEPGGHRRPPEAAVRAGRAGDFGSRPSGALGVLTVWGRVRRPAYRQVPGPAYQATRSADGDTRVAIRRPQVAGPACRCPRQGVALVVPAVVPRARIPGAPAHDQLHPCPLPRRPAAVPPGTTPGRTLLVRRHPRARRAGRLAGRPAGVVRAPARCPAQSRTPRPSTRCATGGPACRGRRPRCGSARSTASRAAGR